MARDLPVDLREAKAVSVPLQDAVLGAPADQEKALCFEIHIMQPEAEAFGEETIRRGVKPRRVLGTRWCLACASVRHRCADRHVLGYGIFLTHSCQAHVHRAKTETTFNCDKGGSVR